MFRLLYSSLLVGFAFSCFAGVLTRLVPKEEAKTIFEQHNAFYGKERLLVVIINPSDCGYCLNSIAELNTPKPYTKTVFLSSVFLNTNQILSLRSDYSIDSSISIECDASKVETIQKAFATGGDYSSMVYVLNANVLSSVRLKEYSSFPMLKKQYRLEGVQYLQQDGYFFSSLGNVVNGSGGYYGVTYPKADIAYFDSSGMFKTVLELEKKELRRVFNENLRDLSADQVLLNDFDSALSTYGKVLKPMGFKTLQAEKIVVYKGDIWAVIVGKFPVWEKEDRVVFDGNRMLAKLSFDDEHIVIDKVLFFNDTVPMDSSSWFVYSPNYLRIEKDCLYLGFGSAKNGEMRLDNQYKLRKYTLSDDMIYSDSDIDLFPIADKLYDFNDTVGNLAFICDPIFGKASLDVSFRSFPLFELDSINKSIFLDFDLSENKYSYYNLRSVYDSTGTEILSLVNFKGWTYFIKISKQNGVILDIRPVSFGEDYTVQRVNYDSRGKVFQVLSKTSNNEFVLGNIELQKLLH